MTVFAGAYCFNLATAVPADLVRSLKVGLRTIDDNRGTRSRYETNSFVLETWDSGAFGEPALQVDADGVSKVAGDPILDVEPRTRLTQLMLLRQAVGDEQLDLLANSRGSFAFVDYKAGSHRLVLTTDVIGLRPIYYAVQDGVVVFSTALRVLENIPWLRRSLSSQGMAELCAFSFPLADRTPYAEINVLRECELISVADGRMSHRTYFDWSEASPLSDETAINSLSAQLHQLFADAVSMRAAGDISVYSFLSGGMDSRAIVAMLLNNNLRIEALNFSYIASQDHYYAQQFAADVGSPLTLHCMEGGGDYLNYSFLARDARTALEATKSIHVDRPECIWSGDGGSVGLGHVYMDEEMLDIADQKGLRAAAEYFLKSNRIGFSTKVMSPVASRTMPDLLQDAVIAEMERYSRNERGRQMYLFLLFNDQRRHLFKHFETIDQHGVELLTPFFDSKFLKAIASTPIRKGILHRLYADWFDLLPEVARRTPWQTYPGHVPCPIKSDTVGSYQWTKNRRRVSIGERLMVARRILVAFGSARKTGVFSTARIALAAIMQALGLRDGDHIAAMLEMYAIHAKYESRSTNQS